MSDFMIPFNGLRIEGAAWSPAASEKNVDPLPSRGASKRNDFLTFETLRNFSVGIDKFVATNITTMTKTRAGSAVFQKERQRQPMAQPAHGARLFWVGLFGVSRIKGEGEEVSQGRSSAEDAKRAGLWSRQFGSHSAPRPWPSAPRRFKAALLHEAGKLLFLLGSEHLQGFKAMLGHGFLDLFLNFGDLFLFGCDLGLIRMRVGPKQPEFLSSAEKLLPQRGRLRKVLLAHGLKLRELFRAEPQLLGQEPLHSRRPTRPEAFHARIGTPRSRTRREHRQDHGQSNRIA